MGQSPDMQPPYAPADGNTSETERDVTIEVTLSVKYSELDYAKARTKWVTAVKEKLVP